MKNYYRKFKKNAKALSPVVASIILIAVTVAVSVVVAAWMSGMTFGLMGSAEQAKITNVQFTGNNVATITVQNNGANTITISSTSATIDGNTETLTGWGTPAAFTVAKSATEQFTITLPTGTTFQDGSQYAFQLTTAKGNTLTFTQAYSANPSL
jgi:flagellin-like protein